ncbi:hypothetical protein DYB35_010035 [Aphanomyces astaci]|uniref:Uncharacterized protein n=1 Tax=Aphanomyces astaci TaxID=112090 RepID=A0A418CS28_APHAT|nr:hypothetical protein DYB35_010035 [Aphanomyces astaci]
MKGYAAPGTTPVVNSISDFTNKNLNSFLEMIIGAYVGLPVNYSVCKYGCSENFSWNVTVYPSSFPFETEMEDLNPNMHTQNDTIDTIDFNHMADFTKLSIAYVALLNCFRGGAFSAVLNITLFVAGVSIQHMLLHAAVTPVMSATEIPMLMVGFGSSAVALFVQVCGASTPRPLTSGRATRR